jgi:hypothetical protein
MSRVEGYSQASALTWKSSRQLNFADGLIAKAVDELWEDAVHSS